MNVQASFQNPMFNAVNMNPGDVWYLTVKNERLNGAPSCAQGSSCNFAITLSAPSRTDRRNTAGADAPTIGLCRRRSPMRFPGPVAVRPNRPARLT